MKKEEDLRVQFQFMFQFRLDRSQIKSQNQIGYSLGMMKKEEDLKIKLNLLRIPQKRVGV